MEGEDLYVDDVASMLELEEVDRNLYRARNGATSKQRLSLYGGQVAAQALMAAALTVESGRLPHSLHGYFLRPGQIDRPVILSVDPDRDGRSFSARHVAAVQDGKVIFSMLASFHHGKPANVLDQAPIKSVAPPAECRDFSFDPAVEVREVTHTAVVDGRQLFTDCLWARTASAVPDDPLIQCCALVYLSDLGSGFGQMGPEVGTGGSSIDHAIWFHEQIRADDWVLLDMRPRTATGIRGLYEASMRDQNGRLAAVVAQENLLRQRSAGEESGKG
jgi:acyl-CoA thioesterase II